MLPKSAILDSYQIAEQTLQERNPVLNAFISTGKGLFVSVIWQESRQNTEKW